MLRDQLFSQDMRGEAVKRIEDVAHPARRPVPRGRRAARPIRSGLTVYREISNFYTSDCL